MFEGSLKETLSVTERRCCGVSEAPVWGDSALIPKMGKGRWATSRSPAEGSCVFTCVRGGEADAASLRSAGTRSPGERREGSGFGQSLDSSPR